MATPLEKMGILDLLNPIIVNNLTKRVSVEACLLIRFLSRESSLRKRLSDSKSLILESLVLMAKTQSATEIALGTLGNICSLKDLVERYINPQLGIIAVALETMKASTDPIVKLRAVRVLTNISNILNPTHSRIMVEIGAIRTALEIIRDDGGEDPLTWPGGAHNGYIGGCVVFLQSICRFRCVAAEAKILGGREILEPLILVPPSISSNLYIFASFAVAFISGRDEAVLKSSKEASRSLSLLQQHPEIVAEILTVMNNTMSGKAGEGCEFGVFQMNVILSAIVALSISDSNKAILVKTDILSPILKALRAYRDNDPPFQGYNSFHWLDSAGGGGSDVEAASRAVEALLQLSFHFDSDQALVEQFMPPALGISTLLRDILLHRPHAMLDTEMKSNIGILLQRLSAPSPSPSPAASSTSTSSTTSSTSTANMASIKSGGTIVPVDRHVMISYAWGTKKEIVVAFAAELRRAGFEVWRDEDGSAFVPSMSGDVQERMVRESII